MIWSCVVRNKYSDASTYVQISAPLLLLASQSSSRSSSSSGLCAAVVSNTNADTEPAAAAAAPGPSGSGLRSLGLPSSIMKCFDFGCCCCCRSLSFSGSLFVVDAMAWNYCLLLLLPQALQFLVLGSKGSLTFDDITQHICPSLSHQQLYRLCTTAWSNTSDKQGKARIYLFSRSYLYHIYTNQTTVLVAGRCARQFEDNNSCVWGLSPNTCFCQWVTNICTPCAQQLVAIRQMYQDEIAQLHWFGCSQKHSLATTYFVVACGQSCQYTYNT